MTVGHFSSNSLNSITINPQNKEINDLKLEIKELKSTQGILLKIITEFMEQYAKDKEQYNKNFFNLDSRC